MPLTRTGQGYRDFSEPRFFECESVSQITQIRNPVDKSHAVVAQDGALALWKFDSSSTATANGFEVIAPLNPGVVGRWLRSSDSTLISVRLFGATGDGTTDDTAAVQAAADAAALVDGDQRAQVYFPPGRYVISSVTTTVDFVAFGNLNRGNRVLYPPVILYHKAGATDDMIVLSASGVRKSITVKGLTLIGKPDQNRRDPKLITSVASRTSFNVDPGDVPTYSPAGSYPYYGWATLYSDENRFIGTVMVQAVNAGTGELTIVPGTDNYATKTGSGGLLTVGFQICFPQEHTITINTGATVTQFSSAKAGYAAVRFDYGSGNQVQDCSFYLWHCGVVQYYDQQLNAFDCETYGCHLGGLVRGFTSYGSDWKVRDIIHSGTYIPDLGSSAETNTYDDELYRCSVSSIIELPIQSIVTGLITGASVNGLIVTLGGNSHITNLAVEGCIKEWLWYLRGPPSAANGGAFFVDRIRVVDRAEAAPGYRTNVAGIRLNGSYVRVVVPEITLGRWPGADGSWTWDYIYDVQSAATNALEICNVNDPDGMVVADKPALSARASFQVHSNTQVSGGEDGTNILALRRDTLARFGYRITGGATLQLMIDADDDGVFTGPVVSWNNDGGNRTILGDPSGKASPTTGIIAGEDGLGTDIAAQPLAISAGRSTGNASSANVQLQVGVPGSSGTTLQTRATAVAASYSATAGQTRLLVFDVDSGLLQRVKVGANGTGPGGVGRALYIDNV